MGTRPDQPNFSVPAIHDICQVFKRFRSRIEVTRVRMEERLMANNKALGAELRRSRVVAKPYAMVIGPLHRIYRRRKRNRVFGCPTSPYVTYWHTQFRRALHAHTGAADERYIISNGSPEMHCGTTGH